MHTEPHVPPGVCSHDASAQAPVACLGAMAELSDRRSLRAVMWTAVAIRPAERCIGKPEPSFFSPCQIPSMSDPTAHCVYAAKCWCGSASMRHPRGHCAYGCRFLRRPLHTLSTESSPPCRLRWTPLPTTLPQLVAIGLDRCFYTDSMFHRFRESVKPDTTVDQPSRLTGPTFLCLRDNTIARKDVGVKCRQGAAADEDAAAPVGIQRG